FVLAGCRSAAGAGTWEWETEISRRCRVNSRRPLSSIWPGQTAVMVCDAPTAGTGAPSGAGSVGDGAKSQADAVSAQGSETMSSPGAGGVARQCPRRREPARLLNHGPRVPQGRERTYFIETVPITSGRAGPAR